MCINKELRDKQMTGIGNEGDSMFTMRSDGTQHAVAFAQNVRDEVRLQNGDGQIVGALSAESGMHQTSYIAQPLPFDTTQLTCPSNYSSPKPGDPCHPLAAGAHIPAVATSMQVRRLTPVECERLQGFPDNFTRIPWKRKPAEDCPDGPRYKALGNSMAVPCMRWIGERIGRQAC
jgi:DNA (cytosine-5)-methyltransferase 1